MPGSLLSTVQITWDVNGQLGLQQLWGQSSVCISKQDSGRCRDSSWSTGHTGSGRDLECCQSNLQWGKQKLASQVCVPLSCTLKPPMTAQRACTELNLCTASGVRTAKWSKHLVSCAAAQLHTSGWPRVCESREVWPAATLSQSQARWQGRRVCVHLTCTPAYLHLWGGGLRYLSGRSGRSGRGQFGSWLGAVALVERSACDPTRSTAQGCPSLVT